MVWKAAKDGSYTVKSNMDMLEGGRGAVYFPKRLGWNHFIPTKVGFFVWEALGAGNDFGSAIKKRRLPCK